MIKLIFVGMNQKSPEDVFQVLTQDLALLEQSEALARMEEFIHSLLLNDFNGLIYLLYRVDVDEQKLKSILEEQKDRDASAIKIGRAHV